MATFGQEMQFGPYFSGGRICTFKLYHYLAGTTTKLDVYAEREKATTLSQPLLSDANGIASFFGDGLYKFRIDVATDGVIYSTLYTYDKWAVVDQSTVLTGEGAALSSAATLTLGTDGDFFHVTGTTGPITAITGSQVRVTLVFDSTPTITNSGTIILRTGVSHTCVAGDTFVFVNDGAGVWREESRNTLNGTVGGTFAVTGATTFTGVVTATGATIANGTVTTNGGLLGTIAFGKHLDGLTYANNGSDPTNDIDIAVGSATSTHTNPASRVLLSLGSAITKRLDASWATGTNQGGLSSSLSIGNNDYYIHLIRVAGVDDVGFDTSLTAANLIADHAATHYRLIGWIKRVGGAIVAFHIYEIEGGGIELLWDSPTLDIDLANTLTTIRRTDAVKVPLNFSVWAHLNVLIIDATTLSTNWIYCPDQTDLAPSLTAAPLANIATTNSSINMAQQMRIRTSATGLIAARSTLATVDAYRVSTMGFTWARRN